MSRPSIERPDLPEYMTWDELQRLPEDIADQIELWDGRVVWVRRGPGEHQTFTRRLTNSIERCSRKVLVGEWTHDDPDGVRIGAPFPIDIPWSDLEY
ncbi:hypothetical protein [Nocardia brasiliensis]|uniref:hypothetical protein n=1 Tax=Nocardia brasiliensis TaxID=37326 RepID=UPI002458F00B|nr:hypothetical protein [Nocardia brasiliensis]